ncbi:hypothetical protein [Knoellia subterranea]|uniref:Uncharacterized protein n=1 Tax=Knoellia subterranea KCTC 19937 TaxID=1385521 RepID=A0A0A0JMH9_9MICO|nr:hypothetical protein [Knoellia subterranea]KGN36836.1 hypothetical protein N803_17140 [Knoellia subterranea KCTC 19937]
MKDKLVVKVTRDQIQSARALIEFAGGEDKVDPVIVRIARAQRPPRQARTAS